MSGCLDTVVNFCCPAKRAYSAHPLPKSLNFFPKNISHWFWQISGFWNWLHYK